MSGYAVHMRNGRVVLPATGEDGDRAEVTSWDEAADNRQSFVARLSAQTRDGEAVRAAAVLVHHADNRYNSNAISVSKPSADGSAVAARHLGYLYDHFLRRVGVTNLPDLISFARGEVECTVVSEGTDDLAVDLPEPAVLGEAIRTFLARHGVEAAGPPRLDDAPRRVCAHTVAHPTTDKTLRLLATFADPASRIDDLRMTTVRGGIAGRALRLYEAGGSRVIGTLDNQWLQLGDERDRERVLDLLGCKNVLVNRPVTRPKVAEDGTWPRNVWPNVRYRLRAGGLDLRVHDPDAPNSQETFAVYNPTLDVVWVEDSRLIAPALRFLHRQGIDVAEVGVPTQPWRLDDEVPYRALRDPKKPWAGSWLVGPKVSLLPALKSLIPPGVLTAEAVDWADASTPLPRPVRSFELLERHVEERSSLFPEHALTGTRQSCRLCGRLAATFATPIASERLAYCHGCLANALAGVSDDRERAAIAVRELSRLEFDDQPMLASQLDSLHVNPATPVDALTIDTLLLLRFAVGRKGMAWTLLLEAAGFAENGLRTSRGTLIRARDGHLCLSLRERAVCDFLHLHGIVHDREPLYPQDPDYNPSGLRRADWLLRDGALVEFWGFTRDPEYAAKMAEKRLLAQRHGLLLVELDDDSLPNLPQVFRQWLSANSPPSWTWSPLVAPAHPSAAQAAKPRPRDDGRGRNDFNVQARNERVSRCATAVLLQQRGFSRAEIGRQLGTTAEAVKSLLRDGKFYADPNSDPARADRAAKAAAAQKLGRTREEFKSHAKLSSAKVMEAWRDADILRDKRHDGLAPK